MRTKAVEPCPHCGSLIECAHVDAHCDDCGITTPSVPRVGEFPFCPSCVAAYIAAFNGYGEPPRDP